MITAMGQSAGQNPVKLHTKELHVRDDRLQLASLRRRHFSRSQSGPIASPSEETPGGLSPQFLPHMFAAAHFLPATSWGAHASWKPTFRQTSWLPSNRTSKGTPPLSTEGSIAFTNIEYSNFHIWLKIFTSIVT